MNIYNFQTSLEYFGSSGITLSTEQCVVLRNHLIILQNENHFHQVFLWGKIMGLTKDYYIAYGYEKDILHGRVFYYSVDCMNWGLLPKATSEYRNLALTCSTRFQGDPAFVEQVATDATATVNEPETLPSPRDPLKDEKAAEAAAPDGGGGGEGGAGAGDAPTDEIVLRVGQIKEENRLAAVVELVNEEAAVVPRGSLVKRHDGYVVNNLGFSGMTSVDAADLRCFFHFRPPIQKWNTNLLVAEENYNFSLDFLDTIDRDIPDGRCWSRQFLCGGQVVLLRNLYWPGSTFYHRLHSLDHGFLYVGNGKREIDLPFTM